MSTTKDKLNSIKNSKAAIRQSIIDSAVEVAESDPFRVFPEKVSQIPTGTTIENEVGPENM